VRQGGGLRESRFVIVDEAHKLKEAARSVFGDKLSEGTMEKYLNRTKTDCISKELNGLYRQRREEIQGLNKELFKKLRSMIPADDDSGEDNVISLDAESKKVINALFEAVSALEEIKKDVKGMSEVNGNRIRNRLRRFIEDGDLSVWLETKDNGEITLCCCSKNIGNSLRKNVWSLKRSHVFTSGTMSDGASFDFFKQENGLDRIANNEMIEYSNPSPFDYENHTRLYLPGDLPAPDNDNDIYVKAVADRIVELVNATNGHTAILFTSYKLLSKVYELTKKRLGKYNVIRMTKSDRTAISEFKKSKNGVLFASGSMWEGVDCVGDCLSSVIIVRLPFPLRTATMNEKKANSASVEEFIHKYAVPEMLIKLRQGVGRLVRCETDTGIVAILDCRATRGSYADNVQHTLRKYPVIESLEEVEKFIMAMKDKSYFD
jgi:ATP-dependent DNA helicase DinG